MQKSGLSMELPLSSVLVTGPFQNILPQQTTFVDNKSLQTILSVLVNKLKKIEPQ